MLWFRLKAVRFKDKRYFCKKIITLCSLLLTLLKVIKKKKYSVYNQDVLSEEATKDGSVASVLKISMWKILIVVADQLRKKLIKL